MRSSVFSLLLLSLVAAAPATQPVDTQIKALINQLGDMQSSVREKATSELTAKGLAARALLVEASKSEDPEIASRAKMILRSLPWDRPTDPPAVRNLLSRYNSMTPEQRATAVSELSNLPGNVGLDAALRLLRDETDQRIRWQIVRQIHTSLKVPPTTFTADQVEARRRAVQAIDTTADDAPLLALAAVGWKDEKDDLAATLCFRAVLAGDFPADANDDDGEIENAYRMAIYLLWPQRKFEDIAKLMRHKARTAVGDADLIAGVPEGVCDLFATHAKVGPLAGFADDCRQYRAFLLRPPVLYTFSFQLMRNRHTLLSQWVDHLAFMGSGNDAAMHLQVARFLHNNLWQRQAISEYKTYLALQKDDDSLDHKTEAANVHLALGILFGQSYEHLNAAKEVEAGLTILAPLPAVLTVNRDGRTISGEDAKRDLQADMNGHYLLDALARDDQEEIAKRVELLMSLDPQDSEVVQEMVAYFTKAGDTATADKLFAGPEQRLREKLKNEGNALQQNSLAWYLARSGRKLDEALKLATQATASEPDNVALMDTLAEVHFQMGHQAEAIRLETAALQKDPDRPELESQLKRFKRGK